MWNEHSMSTEEIDLDILDDFDEDDIVGEYNSNAFVGDVDQDGWEDNWEDNLDEEPIENKEGEKGKKTKKAKTPIEPKQENVPDISTECNADVDMAEMRKLIILLLRQLWTSTNSTLRMWARRMGAALYVKLTELQNYSDASCSDNVGTGREVNMDEMRRKVVSLVQRLWASSNVLVKGWARNIACALQDKISELQEYTDTQCPNEEAGIS